MSSTARSPLSRLLYVLAGSLSLALGVIGIFLPLLPTVPFLLLTAWCFNRGSPRFHAWLLGHPLFGPPVLDWQREGAVRTRYKVIATAMVAVTSVYLLSRPSIPLAGKAGFSAFVLAMLAYLWTRPAGGAR